MGDEIYDGVLLNIAQREAARGGAPALLEVFLGFLRRRTGESCGARCQPPPPVHAFSK